jgi:hypothetical protein
MQPAALRRGAADGTGVSVRFGKRRSGARRYFVGGRGRRRVRRRESGAQRVRPAPPGAGGAGDADASLRGLAGHAPATVVGICRLNQSS